VQEKVVKSVRNAALAIACAFFAFSATGFMDRVARELAEQRITHFWWTFVPLFAALFLVYTRSRRLEPQNTTLVDTASGAVLGLVVSLVVIGALNIQRLGLVSVVQSWRREPAEHFLVYGMMAILTCGWLVGAAAGLVHGILDSRAARG
jgi:ABC-type Fe3+-siderophore transport system permease subunit